MTAFKLDENLPIEAAAIFRGAGHDAAAVVDQVRAALTRDASS